MDLQLNFLDVLLTVVSLVILTIPGFILAKTKVFGKEADKALSGLVLYGCQPMLMFVGFQKTSFNSSIAINMLIVAGIALFVHLAMIGIMFLIIKNKRKRVVVDGDTQSDENSSLLERKKNCVRFASVFSNCGYMGVPFLTSLFGGSAYEGEILIYGSIVIAVFNLLNWSLGVYMMTGDKKDMSIKKALLNPTIIGIFVGLILFLTVQTPLVDIATAGSTLDKILEKFMSACNFLANMVTPLAMIVIGVRLANVNFKSLFLDKWAYVVCACKLVLMSLIAIFSVAFLPIDLSVKYAIFFLLSMPSATATVLFAVNFGGDGDSASVFVLLSTVTSIITIPLMYLLFKAVIGV